MPEVLPVGTFATRTLQNPISRRERTAEPNPRAVLNLKVWLRFLRFLGNLFFVPSERIITKGWGPSEHEKVPPERGFSSGVIGHLKTEQLVDL